jgi:hypothetical protein
MTNIISEEDFDNLWGAKGTDDGGLLEHTDVLLKPLRKIWTVVEGDNDDMIAMPGFRVVNALGYVLTTKNWTHIGQMAYWFKREIPVEQEGERSKLILFLRTDWLNSFADDVDNTFDAMYETLRQGCVGYDNMPIEDLRREAEDAGYDPEDDAADDA